MMDWFISSAKAQTVIGGAIVTPGLLRILDIWNGAATTVSVTCGAIIGVYGVYRLWKNRNKP